MQSQTSSTQTAPDFDKRTLIDAAHIIGIGQNSLDWLDAVLHAISLLHEKGGGSAHIKSLVEMGHYVASDIGGWLDGERGRFAASAKIAGVSQ